MSNVTPIKAASGNATSKDEWQMRVDLAAMFRIAARMNWHEAVANHFSLAVSANGKKFLMNPKWMHFSRIRARDLLLLDADDTQVMNRPDAPDQTAWCIHGAIHQSSPQAACVLHLHPAYSTTLASLADPTIKPIEQNTARFFQRVAYDNGFEGMADSFDEGQRLTRVLGNQTTLMMGNHGVLVTGASVAEAFDRMYYLERACQTLVMAYSTGQKLNILSDKVAEQTAQDWEAYSDSAFSHFEEMKKILDAEDPSYAE